MPKGVRMGYKDEAIKAAKDLHYGKHVINKLIAARNENEVGHIMASARKERLD